MIMRSITWKEEKSIELEAIFRYGETNLAYLTVTSKSEHFSIYRIFYSSAVVQHQHLLDLLDEK